MSGDPIPSEELIPKSLPIVAAHFTEHGGRSSQQDRIFIPENPWSTRIWAIADGAGGTAQGEKAAQISIDAFKLFEIGQTNQELKPTPDTDDAETLFRIFVHAHKAVRELNGGNPNLGLATLAAFRYNPINKSIVAMGLGDVQIAIYTPDARYRQQWWNHTTPITSISQLLEPHNRKQEALNRGIVPGPDAEHMLTKSVGSMENLRRGDVSIARVSGIKPGDILAMYSDGIAKTIPDNILRSVLTELASGKSYLEKTGDDLITLAQKRGETDNITLSLFQFK